MTTPLSNLVLYEEDFIKIEDEIKRLRQQTNATVIFLVDRDGQLIASCGEEGEIDTTSLASLTAGNIAATGGMAKLIGEKEFSILFHEGEKDNIHISVIAKRVILVIIFDHRSSLGLVRLRVKKSSEVLNQVFEEVQQKRERPGEAAETIGSPLEEITDEDIDRLFG